MKFVFIAVLFLVYAPLQAQKDSLYQKHVYANGGDTIAYRLLLPENYDSAKAYPLILFLHGAGERGSDNARQLVHGSSVFLRDSVRRKYPAIVVFPQCPENGFWSNVQFTVDSVARKAHFDFKADREPTKAMAALLKLVQNLEQTYRLKKDQLYVGGLSMGGMGTFELVNRLPDTFAAAIAICGGGDTATAANLKNTAWWIFHGLRDQVVDPVLSKQMAAALKESGANVKLTLYPEDGHDSWDSAFAEPDLLSWLFSVKLAD